MLNYEGKASSKLPIGTTNLSISAPFTPIVNGTSMTVSYTPANSVILWQNLSLGGLGNTTAHSLRLDPLTTEDWSFGDDGSAAMNMFTYTTQSAATPTTISAHYSTSGVNSIFTKATYDNTLNLIAFKVPAANTYGKTLFSGSASESAGSLTSLINIPITNSSSKRSLISFTVNSASGDAAGNGCDFALFINNVQTAMVPLVSSNNFQSLQTSLITVESIPAGVSIPVEIKFSRYISGTCNVNSASLNIIPLE